MNFYLKQIFLFFTLCTVIQQPLAVQAMEGDRYSFLGMPRSVANYVWSLVQEYPRTTVALGIGLFGLLSFRYIYGCNNNNIGPRELVPMDISPIRYEYIDGIDELVPVRVGNNIKVLQLPVAPQRGARCGYNVVQNLYQLGSGLATHNVKVFRQLLNEYISERVTGSLQAPWKKFVALKIPYNHYDGYVEDISGYAIDKLIVFEKEYKCLNLANYDLEITVVDDINISLNQEGGDYVAQEWYEKIKKAGKEHACMHGYVVSTGQNYALKVNGKELVGGTQGNHWYGVFAFKPAHATETIYFIIDSINNQYRISDPHALTFIGMLHNKRLVEK